MSERSPSLDRSIMAAVADLPEPSRRRYVACARLALGRARARLRSAEQAAMSAVAESRAQRPSADELAALAETCAAAMSEFTARYRTLAAALAVPGPSERDDLAESRAQRRDRYRDWPGPQ